MNVPTYLPWQTDAWQRLQSRAAQQQLPHALLLTGKEGIGKRDFALALAHSLLCSSPQDDGSACGHCKSCLLIAAGNHPDLMLLEPEEEGKAIKVGQVRQVVDFMSLTSQYGQYKIVVISPADQMNINASNSLLKTLEEPTANSILLLESSQPGLLPATVRSRCQRIQLPLPDALLALDWLARQITSKEPPEQLLALAGGAPLLARFLADTDLPARRRQRLDQLRGLLDNDLDAVATAAKWDLKALEQELDWFSGWIMDLIRLKSTGNQELMQHPDEQSHLQILAERLDLPVLFQFYDELNQVRRLNKTQVNKQLLLEGLLIQWSAGYTDSRR
jgi:DNA polymerase-3 subunit delta'